MGKDFLDAQRWQRKFDMKHTWTESEVLSSEGNTRMHAHLHPHTHANTHAHTHTTLIMKT
ncbi:hypothetical protein MTR_2g018370 [Medicago truncatula]|uniref:Uncharacterized protein n=1 Tax=Medicago truncatula TaxID=3880 RepID=G7ILW9_MEDTR|nr:hypothetical protein MTR_2g018370 [Medicago truncatula]